MNNSLILHHYESSPYAEKIRLMLGLTNAQWYSCLTSVQPPRPSVDPLTGGYRRIPVAQIGADIFCDSALIAQEISNMYGAPALDVTTQDDTALALMQQAEKEAFFAAIGAVPPLRLLGSMLRFFGPLGMYRFAKDRAGMLKGGTVRPPKGQEAEAIIGALVDNLERRLEQQAWVGGDQVSIADFATYHPLWLHVLCNRRDLKAGPKVTDWYRRVADIGHGQQQEISKAEVFKIAHEAEPRALPDVADESSGLIGKQVAVMPSDYAMVAVEGTLVASNDERIIVLRETSDFGNLHVHFPKAGYSLNAI